MKNVRLSIFVWAIYMLLQGFMLILIPGKTTSLFGYDVQDVLWVRLLGLLSVVLALYYYQVANKQIQELYFFKVVGHLIGIIVMLVFFITGTADSKIFGTLIIEMLACLWTGVAIVKSSSS